MLLLFMHTHWIAVRIDTVTSENNGRNMELLGQARTELEALAQLFQLSVRRIMRCIISKFTQVGLQIRNEQQKAFHRIAELGTTPKFN